MTSPRRFVLAGASGALLVLSFPKFGNGAVGLFALAPLFIALRGASPWHGFLLGYVSGVVSSLGLVYWTSLVVTQFGGMPLPVGIAVMVLLCLTLGLFPALVGLSVARLGRDVGPAALLLGPGLLGCHRTGAGPHVLAVPVVPPRVHAQRESGPGTARGLRRGPSGVPVRGHGVGAPRLQRRW